MKRPLLSALTILLTSVAITPVASAVEPANFNMGYISKLWSFCN